jgi:hypothetical protein
LKKKTQRVEMRAQCDAFATKLSDELHTVITERVDTLLFAAHTQAVGVITAAFDAAFGGRPVEFEEVTAPPQEPVRTVRATKPPVANAIATKPAAPTKAVGQLTCSKCGTPGHNARSCGRTPKGHRSPTEKGAKPWLAALERTRAARQQLDTHEADE